MPIRLHCSSVLSTLLLSLTVFLLGLLGGLFGAPSLDAIAQFHRVSEEFRPQGPDRVVTLKNDDDINISLTVETDDGFIRGIIAR